MSTRQFNKELQVSTGTFCKNLILTQAYRGLKLHSCTCPSIMNTFIERKEMCKGKQWRGWVSWLQEGSPIGVLTRAFFSGDTVSFLASRSGFLQKYTNLCWSLPHCVANKKSPSVDFLSIPNLLIQMTYSLAKNALFPLICKIVIICRIWTLKMRKMRQVRFNYKKEQWKMTCRQL
jgi:hypothetical protein